MPDKIAFELVSPERLLVSEEVDMVVVPGSEGDFGVMAGHQPMISSVRPGIVEIHDGSSEIWRIFVNGGFAEVTGANCAVMTEEAVPAEDMNRADIEIRIKDAGEDLTTAKTDHQRHLIEIRMATLKNMLEAAKG
jgi:F-type H+-transporting ATPase subunit epsilon